MKKDNRAYTWKGELWNGIGELILAFAAIGIGLGIAFLLPHETIKDIPAELFFMLGGLILFAAIGIVALTIHLIRQKRKNKDIKFIYNTLKNKYKLTLMLVTRSINGEMRDSLIIKGQSSKGKFELCEEGEMFNFSIEYFGKFNEDRYCHEILNDKNETINCIENFMSE